MGQNQLPKADIQKVESTVQEAKAGIYKDISDAARGVTQEISGVAKDVAGVGREILNNRFTTERGLCDLGYKTNCHTGMIRKEYIYQGCTPFFVLTT